MRVVEGQGPLLIVSVDSTARFLDVATPTFMLKSLLPDPGPEPCFLARLCFDQVRFDQLAQALQRCASISLLGAVLR